MPFEFERCEIPDVVLVKPKVFGDERGFFMESYKESDFKAFGLPTHYAQDNHSKSKAGVLRGLHYQIDPYAQGKLVRVVTGKIFDVAVDIRKGSPTYGQWVGRELSEQNKHMLWVPAGFAHGLLVLEDDTHLLYKCTSEYQPVHERSILWNDPALAVKWPLRAGEVPSLSAKDANGMTFAVAMNQARAV